MLLANSCVSGKAATGHVLMYAPTGGFPRILALHPKALRQIGNLWFSERTTEVLTNLLLEIRFFCGEWGGDRSIGEANLRKGAALQWLAHLAPVRGAVPFNGCGTAVPFNGSGPAAPFYGCGTAARPRFSSKMDSLAWLRWAGAGRACRRGGKPALAIGKANAPGLYFFVGGLEEIKEFSRLYF